MVPTHMPPTTAPTTMASTTKGKDVTTPTDAAMTYRPELIGLLLIVLSTVYFGVQ